LVFEKNANFFAEKWHKSQKIVIITSTPGHPYLDDDFVGVESLRLPLDVALDVVVAHLDGELDLVLHIDHAAVRVVLGVDFAVEELVGPGRIFFLLPKLSRINHHLNSGRCGFLHFLCQERGH
jgi:hypothetical protein